MKRAFKGFVVTTPGTPQPLVGTTLAQAIIAGTNNVNVQVADSSMFVKGDWSLLIDANGANRERVMVASIPDGTHVVLQGENNKVLAFNRAIGAFLQLSGACSSVIVQGGVANAAGLYIGARQTIVKATLAGVIYRLIQTAAGIQPPAYVDGSSTSSNSDDMANWWIDADNNTDIYLPSFGII